VAIYCLNCTAREERAVVGQLRTVATKQGWTVIKAFVDRPGAGRTQWAALNQALAAREADLVMIPSFAGIGESVSDVLEEIVRLRDATCDIYVHDAGLDTTSPIDQVLFRIVDALRSVEKAGAKRSAAALDRAARSKTVEATPYQHSVIRGALSSGLKPREVAKLLKVPIGLVHAVAKEG
jgi:DNA invertase Pin-like site-specific DNA recombinase